MYFVDITQRLNTGRRRYIKRIKVQISIDCMHSSIAKNDNVTTQLRKYCETEAVLFEKKG